MAKSLGNIPYSEIIKDRENITRREGINKDLFEKLVAEINICGFENNDESLTVYFKNIDLEKFESIVNNSDKNDLKIIIKRFNDFEEKLIGIVSALIKEQNSKKNEDTEVFNKKLDDITKYIAEYCSIINEISMRTNSAETSSDKSVVEIDTCGNRIEELTNKFDNLYGDIIRNIAYLRSDLKIKIGKKSISEKKQTFFIFLLGALSFLMVEILFKKYLIGWFL